MIEWIGGGVLTAAALAAVWYDVRERRIPNALTVGAFAAALLVRSTLGLEAIGAGLVGAVACFLLALPLFLAGGLGGGDVKLLAAFGAFLGLDRLLPALLVTALAGGALAFVAIVRRRAVTRTLWNLYFILKTLGRKTFTGWRREGSEAWMTLETPGAIAVPYGVAISLGAVYGWWFA